MSRLFIVLLFWGTTVTSIVWAGNRSDLFNAPNSDNPLQNRARAYQDKGALKLAIENFGRFGGASTPQALWWDFQYINNLSLVMGVPGKDTLGNPYPWAVGRKQAFNVETNEFFTVGTDTTYWGPTVSEAWFDRTTNLNRTDWEAVDDAQIRLHNPNATAGKYYGRYGYYTNAEDTYPLVATSTIPATWPVIDGQPVWPGHWAVDPNDPTGDTELNGVFVSDQDIYFEFDDRLATRDVDTTQGYPIGVRVEVSSYSFADTSARDMIFFNMVLHNESDYNYRDVYVGLYLDADIYSRLSNGSYAGRTNEDDIMSYDLQQSMAYIYDLDGDHDNPYVGGKKLAYCALKFLDTPTASKDMDLTNDGNVDVTKGDKLGLTGWHWFDWYFRPGASDVSSYEGPWSGDGSTPVAENKEEIQYKILAGDTANLTAYDSTHYFHPSYSAGKVDKLNPYFDSPDGLLYEYPEGLDCIFIMTTGPFDLNAGDSAPFSFCLIMAQDLKQLELRANTAQRIFENNYRLVPTVITKDKTHSIISGFQLAQNYPNPFNSRTRINLTVPRYHRVRLALFNTLGQKVKELLNKPLTPGDYTVNLDASDLASGVYVYRLYADGSLVGSKKMILIR